MIFIVYIYFKENFSNFFVNEWSVFDEMFFWIFFRYYILK